MKLKTVKIVNYKSYCEEDNLLVLEDISTIIGKNESGKSSLIEAISYLDYNGVVDSFYSHSNININKEAELSITIESEEISETRLTFKKDKKIYIEKGLSNYILKNDELQENLSYIVSNKKNKISKDLNISNWYNEILSLLSKCDKIIFNYDKIKLNLVIKHLKSELVDVEYVGKMCWCIDYLTSLYSTFPKILRVNNDELKEKYLRSEIENDKEKKENLLQLLDCLDYTIEDIKNYWKLPSQAEKDEFADELKDKAKKFIEKFNEFYTQDSVQFIPTIETTGLYFNIKTNGKRIGLEERSNGLRWYLNLYIQIKSKIKNSSLKNCVIIMDEPGVYLHVDAQKELRKLFENLIENQNQIIYTTHSPFMIYDDKLYRTKLIIKDQNGNTHISNKYYHINQKLSSKMETISPMLRAIGMSMHCQLFGEDDKINIITEGISDYNYIKAYLIQRNIVNKYNIVPSAGVSNVNHLVSIFIGWNCKFKIILDQDKAGRGEYRKIIKELAVNNNDIIFTDLSKLPSNISNNSIEDLFSSEDKEKIGINTDNYKNEKAAESLSLLGKIQNGIEKLSEETINNFDKLFEMLQG